MKRIFFLLLIASSIMAVGCGNGTEQEAESDKDPSELDALYDELMTIHDEAMPKMSDLNRMSRQIKDIPVEQFPGLDSAEMHRHLDRLEAAEEAMWQWMQAYEKPADSLPAKQVRKYLLEEKEKMQQIANRIDQSLSQAKSWYNNEIAEEQ